MKKIMFGLVLINLIGIASVNASSNILTIEGSNNITKNIEVVCDEGSKYVIEGLVRFLERNVGEGGRIDTRKRYFRSGIDSVSYKSLESGNVEIYLGFKSEETSNLVARKFVIMRSANCSVFQF
jgi:hypothetical protein